MYFEWYRPTGLLLLPLVMLGFVASAVEQTNPNHLGREQSRYLSRAMNQPVDWYPWGADPFKRAKERHRPILLDVGAVWCPWCALMDRDTYTNVDTANYINQHFVAVKVDFDASPKVVAQLRQAQAVLNLPAGLPLTSFITPDGRLYFGASTSLLNAKMVSRLFVKPLMKLSPASRIDPRLRSNHFSWS